MEKVKIIRIYSSDKNKQGVPYLVKHGPSKGKPYKRVAIQVEGGDVPTDTWISKNAYNQNDPALSLQEGNVVDLKIWQSEEGGFWNFDFPKPEDEIKEQISNIYIALDDLTNRIEEIELGRGENVVKAMQKAKEDEPNDTPF